jgi:hypothetical protein
LEHYLNVAGQTIISITANRAGSWPPLDETGRAALFPDYCVGAAGAADAAGGTGAGAAGETPIKARV